MFEQPPGSLIKQLALVLSEREHAGCQTSADTNLQLVRRNPRGENGDQSTNISPPPMRSLKYAGNLIYCTESSDVYRARLDSGSFEVFFFFSFFFFTKPLRYFCRWWRLLDSGED